MRRMGCKTANMDGKNVLRKIGLLLTVAACGALVTSCGDDETTTPTPTDTTTATPTPTPTTAVNFDLAGDFSSTSVNANYIFSYFTPDGGGTEVFSGASRIDGTSTIALVSSPDSATFGFPDLTDEAVFGENEFVSVSATERQYTLGDTALTLFLPFTHTLRVTYQIDSQPFTSGTVDGTLRTQRASVFFNPLTTTDDITADLTYTGAFEVVGGDPGVTASDVISAPDATFTVTAGTDDTLTGSIQIFEDVMGTPTLVASFDIDTIVADGGGFSGTLTDTDNDLTGQFVGGLVGPNREELVILFAAIDANVVDAEDDGDDTTFVGSFIGN